MKIPQWPLRQSAVVTTFTQNEETKNLPQRKSNTLTRYRSNTVTKKLQKNNLKSGYVVTFSPEHMCNHYEMTYIQCITVYNTILQTARGK